MQLLRRFGQKREPVNDVWATSRKSLTFADSADKDDAEILIDKHAPLEIHGYRALDLVLVSLREDGDSRPGGIPGSSNSRCPTGLVHVSVLDFWARQTPEKFAPIGFNELMKRNAIVKLDRYKTTQSRWTFRSLFRKINTPLRVNLNPGVRLAPILSEETTPGFSFKLASSPTAPKDNKATKIRENKPRRVRFDSLVEKPAVLEEIAEVKQNPHPGKSALTQRDISADAKMSNWERLVDPNHISSRRRSDSAIEPLAVRPTAQYTLEMINTTASLVLEGDSIPIFLFDSSGDAEGNVHRYASTSVTAQEELEGPGPFDKKDANLIASVGRQAQNKRRPPTQPEFTSLDLRSMLRVLRTQIDIRNSEGSLSQLLTLKEEELSQLNAGVDASECMELLYIHLALGIEDDQLLLRINRVLFRLILISGRFPETMILKDVSREVDAKGRIQDVLFQGGFGDIYKARCSNRVVALKALRPLVRGSMDRRKAFLKEIIMLATLHHPFIVPFLGVCEEVAGLGDTPCIVFPWFNNGALEQFLENTTHTPEELQTWVLELVQGMEFLHSRSVPVLHGDIRTGNILLDDDLHVRISDFGLSQLERQTQTMTTTFGAGTLQWKAPEMFPVEDEAEVDDHPFNVNDDRVSEPSYAIKSYKTKATDTWALGCTIYEMYEGKYPYHYLRRGNEVNDWRILTALRNGKLPAYFRPETTNKSRTTMPLELWDAVSSCWNREPNLRPDMPELRALIGSSKS